jgi:hypothetical protein
VTENNGMLINDALNIKPQDIVKRLGDLPARKFHCSVLGDKALRAAINDYFRKSGQTDRMVIESSRIVDNETGITDKDIDLLYLGSNSTITEKEKGYVIKVPCFCTHAYVITNKGAKQLMKLVEEQSEGLGMYKADCAIRKWQLHNKLDCRIWNNVGIGFIMPYPILISSKESTEDYIHLSRNNGLIFQNSLLGSSIHGLSLTNKGKF